MGNKFTSFIISEQPWDLREAVWSKAAGSVASDGVHMKTEQIINGIRYYLKLSRYDSYLGIYGHESINELIACRLGKILGFNVPEGILKRSLVRIDDVDYETHVFAAQSFKTGGSRSAFENFYLDNRRSTEESPLEFCVRFGWTDYVYKMFIFDYLIINRDRHGANLEVMKNGDKKLSPFFDNGLSFVCSCTNEVDLDSFNIREDRVVNNFIGDKRLALNLNRISSGVRFNELKESDRGIIFADLNGILSDRYLSIIWDIIWERWQDVKKFRIA